MSDDALIDEISSWQWRQSWRRPECTLFAYARSVRGLLSTSVAKQVENLLQQADSFRDSFRNSLRRTAGGRTCDALAAQATWLLKGMLHGVRAAHALATYAKNRNDDPLLDKFDQAASNCAAAYGKAWRMPAEPLGQLPSVFGPGAAADLVGIAVQRIFHSGCFTTAGYLILRRILSYVLLDDADTPLTHFHTPGTMLLCGAAGQGHARPVAIRSLFEQASGFYLDPIALGFMLVEHSMVKSLTEAWDLCKPDFIRQAQDHRDAPLAVRISPDVAGYPMLEGESAGALFACGIYAAAQQQELDADATVSAVLDADLRGALKPVAEESVLPKLDAAKAANMRHFVLEKDQAKRFEEEGRRRGLAIHGAQNLSEVFDVLAGNARYERVLAAYCAIVRERWERKRNDPNDPDLLNHYVQPYYALAPVSTRPSGPRISGLPTERELGLNTQNYRRICNDPAKGLDELVRQVLFPQKAAKTPGQRWLCMAEDAGAGKTVFTRALQAHLSTPAVYQGISQRKPLLVFRWEGDWPTDFPAAMAGDRDLAEAIRRAGCRVDASDVVHYSTDKHRIVLILDALDQAEAHNQQVVRRLIPFLENGGRLFTVVLTSRAYKLHEVDERLFTVGTWRYGRIELFDRKQQDEYLPGLDQMVPNRNEVDHLLAFPIVLALLRRMIDGAPGNQASQQFRFKNRAELYDMVAEHLVRRAAGKITITPDEVIDRIHRLLAACAFQMMKDGNKTGVVKDRQSVAQLQVNAGIRCGHAIGDDDWSLMRAASEHTERAILEELSVHATHFGWRDFKMMEFYAGVHLARYATERCREELRPHANDSRWEWVWRHCLQLPLLATERDPAQAERRTVRGESLDVLFAPPVSGPRPAELMYLAWGILDPAGIREMSPELDPAGPVLRDARIVIENFRDQFPAILEAPPPTEPAPETPMPPVPATPAGPGRSVSGFLARLFSVVRRKKTLPKEKPLPQPEACHPRHPSQIARELRDGFITLEPGVDGKPEAFQTAWANRPVRVAQPFALGVVPVTNEQFELFDKSHRERRWRGEDKHEGEAYARHPAVNVSWFEAAVYCLWLGPGYRLPAEHEWEYACRAGAEGDYCRVKDERSPAGWRAITEETLGEVAWYAANSGCSTHPVGTKAPNLWGFYDMHGNVWEWCGNWYEGMLQLDAGCPVYPASGSYRVLRGGSWDDDYPDDLRAGYRHHYVPALWNRYCGFRLARTNG